MPPKKKKPTPPQPKRKAFVPHGRAPRERTEVMTYTETEEQMPERPVTQSTSTAAGPFAHIDPEAQAEVQKQLNLRIAHDTRVPFIPAKVPPGLSPNEVIALARAGAIQIPQQTDKPEAEPENEQQHDE